MIGPPITGMVESGMCYNCEEEQAIDGGALCDECRANMWGDQRTHHGTLTERTIEDLERANGGSP